MVRFYLFAHIAIAFLVISLFLFLFNNDMRSAHQLRCSIIFYYYAVQFLKVQVLFEHSSNVVNSIIIDQLTSWHISILSFKSNLPQK